MTTDRELLVELTRALDGGEPVVLATVIGTDRSVPRHAGTKMLVHADGRQLGTIGGGEMEVRVIEAALECLAQGRTRTVSYDLVDPGTGDPGVCGGTVHLYLEPYMPTPHLVVVGCGHVGQAVVELAHWLGFRVTAIDDRHDLATPENLPLASDVLAGPVPEGLAKAGIDGETHVVVVTRNVGVDVEALPVILAAGPRSVGVMGSQRRWSTTRAKLASAGVPAADLDLVTSPIGLDIEAETPEEIALSILGEIVQLRRST